LSITGSGGSFQSRRKPARDFCASTPRRHFEILLRFQEIDWKRSPAIGTDSTVSASTINGVFASDGPTGPKTSKSSTIIKKTGMAQKTTKLRPIPPGAILREDLADIGIGPAELATAIGMSKPAVRGLLAGRSRVSPVVAVRLATFFGTSDRYWMNLQSAYDLQKLSESLRVRIQSKVIPKEQLLRSA